MTVDLRGRGRSDIAPPGYYRDSHVRDLLEIIETLWGRRLSLIDAVGMPEPDAMLSIARSLSRCCGRILRCPGRCPIFGPPGAVTLWDEFWDSHFEGEPEPVDYGVRIGTDPDAVGEDSAYVSTQGLYRLWRRLRCPVQLPRAGKPMASRGVVVSQADADRFAAEAPTPPRSRSTPSRPVRPRSALLTDSAGRGGAVRSRRE